MNHATFDGEKWVKIVHIPKLPYYRIADVARILDVGVAAVYAMKNRGTIKAYLVEEIIMIKHEDLVRFISRREALANYQFVSAEELN